MLDVFDAIVIIYFTLVNIFQKKMKLAQFLFKESFLSRYCMNKKERLISNKTDWHQSTWHFIKFKLFFILKISCIFKN